MLNFLYIVTQFHQKRVSNAQRGFPPKMKTVPLSALHAVLVRTKMKKVATNARSALKVPTRVSPKAPTLANHVNRESTKTKKEKPSARRALPASGATRFGQRMILTVKIAKSASTRLQKALILIVFFARRGHVEKTVSLVVQTRRCVKHAMLGDIVQVKTRMGVTRIQPCVHLVHWVFCPMRAVRNANGVVLEGTVTGAKTA